MGLSLTLFRRSTSLDLSPLQVFRCVNAVVHGEISILGTFYSILARDLAIFLRGSWLKVDFLDEQSSTGLSQTLFRRSTSLDISPWQVLTCVNEVLNPGISILGTFHSILARDLAIFLRGSWLKSRFPRRGVILGLIPDTFSPFNFA